MSQAEKPNIMSRRNALAGLSVAAAAGVAALPAGAAIEPDPIFAVIAEHRAAINAWVRDIDGEHNEGLEDGTPEAEAADDASADGTSEAEAADDASADIRDRRENAFWKVLTVQPTTLPGVAALLDHVGLHQFLFEDDKYPDERETILSTMIHNGSECPYKRVAQDFPVRLAETVRALIGGQS